MNIHLTEHQYFSLFYWGRESADCDGANEAARLLLDVLCELSPVPGRHDELPATRRGRAVGAAVYDYSISLPTVARSPRTRALWAWGYARGCRTVAASMRLLISLVEQAYPDLSGYNVTKKKRPECLGELARLIEQPAA